MLVAAPLRDQLAEPTLDGQTDENARANCVPASLSSALSALLGKAYYGDELKDAVYGQAYTGATDPARYIDYAAQQGAHMWEVQGTGEQLVQTIAAELAQHHPVYGAIPSFWGNTTAAQIAANGGPTHAVLFCDADPAAGTLTAMNPWPVNGSSAFYQVMSATWWASRLVYGHVFPLERSGFVGVTAMGWTKRPDGTGADDQGHTCGTGLMYDLEQKSLTGEDGLLSETFYTQYDAFLPLANERILTVRHDPVSGQWTTGEAGGHAIASIWSMVEQVRNQVQAAQQAQQAAEAQVAALQAQLAQAEASAAATPTDPASPAESDPDPSAAALVVALKTALGLAA